MRNQASPDTLLAPTVVSKALLRLTVFYEFNQKELSEIIGESEASISRLFKGQRHLTPNTKSFELALLLIRLYRSLNAIVGNDHHKAKIWLRSYNSYLGDTPLNQLKSIQGLMLVLQYLDAMRGM